MAKISHGPDIVYCVVVEVCVCVAVIRKTGKDKEEEVRPSVAAAAATASRINFACRRRRCLRQAKSRIYLHLKKKLLCSLVCVCKIIVA